MLDAPELAAPHGARGAQRQGDHDPEDRGDGLGDYTRNVGYKTGSITYEFETKTFNYDRGIKLLADVMDVEEAGVLDCFVAASSELQRTQVAPEADAFTFSEIAGHAGVTPAEEDFADADAEDVLASLRAATNAMDEAEVTTGSRILFITPTLKGVLDDFSLANPARSNRVLERFSRVVEVPQTRFFSAIMLNSGEPERGEPLLVLRARGRGRADQLHGRRALGGDQVRQARGAAGLLA